MAMQQLHSTTLCCSNQSCDLGFYSTGLALAFSHMSLIVPSSHSVALMVELITIDVLLFRKFSLPKMQSQIFNLST
jgi:hypothetical protein